MYWVTDNMYDTGTTLNPLKTEGKKGLEGMPFFSASIRRRRISYVVRSL